MTAMAPSRLDRMIRVACTALRNRFYAEQDFTLYTRYVQAQERRHSPPRCRISTRAAHLITVPEAATIPVVDALLRELAYLREQAKRKGAAA